MVGATLIPYFFLNFARQYLELENNRIFKAINSINILCVFIFIPLFFTNLIIRELEPILTFPFWPKGGFVFPIFLFYFLINVIISLWALFNKFWKTKKIKDFYVFLGTLIAFSGGCTNYFLWLDLKIYPFGNIFISIYALIMAFAIITDKLLDISVEISKNIAEFLTSLFFIGIYLIGYKLLKVFLPSSYYEIAYISFSVFFLILISQYYLYLKEKIQTIPDKLILKSRYNLTEVADTFSIALNKSTSLEELVNVTDFLFKSIGIHPVDFYFPDNFEQTNKDLKVYLKWDIRKKKVNEASGLSKESMIIQQALSTQSPLFYDYADKDLRLEFALLKVDGVIPCVYNQELLCLIALAKEKLKQVKYTPFDKVLFVFIANQMVLALNRLRPYEKLQADYMKSRKIAEEAAMHRNFYLATKQITHEIGNPVQALEAHSETNTSSSYFCRMLKYA